MADITIVPAECWASLTGDFRRLLLREALQRRPSPAASFTEEGDGWDFSVTADTGDLDVAVAVAAQRWLTVMQELLSSSRAVLVQELCARCRQGQQVPAPEALADMRPEMAELIRDGGPGLLALPALRTAYAKFTTAFCRLCCTRMELPKPAADSSLASCCRHFCLLHQQRLRQALQELRPAPGLELACCKAIRLDLLHPEPYLWRSGVRLRQKRRSKAQEDLKVYLVWSAHWGFSSDNHSLAYWRLGECFVEELEHRNATQGALLEDRTFHSLVDSAEISINLAIRYDDGRTGLGTSARAQHLLQRLETMRSARRTAAEFLDSPLVSGLGPEGSHGDAYAVPWPLDVTAGIPDLAMFSRTPTIGSSQTHRPLELLFLGCQGVLDVMATLSNLAVRASAFATEYPECLHWKYRPKPVHLHLHASNIERLAQSLLCFMIMKQMGQAGDEAIDRRNRRLCALLSAVLFCRTLTHQQRKELDRLLGLLILAASGTGSMARAFPWLELDDDRKSTLPMGSVSKSEKFGEKRNEHFSDDGLPDWRAEELLTHLQEPNADADGEDTQETSHLLFHLQQVWIGWLSSGGQKACEETSAESFFTSCPEASEAKAVSPQASLQEPDMESRLADTRYKQLNVAEVHRAARRSLLGARCAATYEALHSMAQVEEQLSQRQLWALTGHLPAREVKGAMFQVEPWEDGHRAHGEDDPEHMRPPDPRGPWRPLLEELLREKDSGLNPCVLEHVSWCYDPQALSDPFLTFSWHLTASNPGDWHSSLAQAPFDAPMGRHPVLEMIWEHLYQQLKRIGSIFHALEARDDSWAMDLRTLNEKPLPPRAAGVRPRRKAPATLRSAAARTAPMSAYFHVKVSDQLRKRVEEEEEEARTIELAKTDIVGELEELKRRRRDLSLELELRDYVTLASMKEKEGDWWGQAARNAAAYGQAETGTATWKPAPEDCAPLRLRIFAYAGRPWHVLKAACFRGATFDAIDAPKLLCEDVGLLGLSTWFDTLLKQVPHSYIQTRHCEEVFLKRLDQRVASEWNPQSARAAAQSGTNGMAATTGKFIPPDVFRDAKQLAGTWRAAPARPRAVLAANGLAKRPGAAESPKLTPRTEVPGILAAKGLDQRLHLTLSARMHRPIREVVNEPARPRVAFPAYTSESKFFEHLARESLTSKASCVQLQCLLGMAFRSEPLLAELGLTYLGAANLRPARRNFLPWDSVLAVSTGWPGDDAQFSEAALGGTKSVSVHESRTLESAAGDTLCAQDVAALITRHSEPPDDEKKARALGPRVLRLRKLGGGHPSLSWDAEEKRCSNAVFCTRRVEAVGKNFSCSKCKCVWYCSKLCQATHFVAHHFECRSLRQLRLASEGFEAGPSSGVLAEVLQELLAKQLSDSHLEATSLGHSLRKALAGEVSKEQETGQQPVHLPALPMEALVRGGHLQSQASNGDLGRRMLDVFTAGSELWPDVGRKLGPVLGSDCFVLLPEEQSQWKVRPRRDAADEEYVSEAQSLKRSRDMFNTQHSVHTAVGIVRLMSRWASTNSMRAVKEVTENGLFFCLITGLCITKHFTSETLSPEAVVAVLSHRMALHVASSQDWSLVPMMRPPAELQERGVAALDCAQYTAYYAFLTHRRLPFKQLRALPIICFAWGNRVRDALLALPHLLEPQQPGKRARRSGKVGSFIDVAREHLSDIQLVDSVQMDELTGRCWFLLYNSLMSSPRTDKEAWILLLDASRGLQAVSCPLPASELRRCAL
ncbi:unnamed protein product [Effrenium voratum]|uniref:MYND-type domain-containing protein n=1 Tax=Effrenium voratum TaxID=2562239 RepID=A0AA36NM73_9DINO|nr:unnamed protein product [Effrenium voratum]